MKDGNRDIFRITPLSGKASDAVPSMPRIFPVGTWKVTGLVNHLDRVRDPYLFPYFISTDAHQPLERWDLDAQGFYLRRTGEFLEDTAYGLHFSTSLYTQGCIRIAEENDLRDLVRMIDFAFVNGSKPEFIVTE
jgi:hypothetical protein